MPKGTVPLHWGGACPVHDDWGAPGGVLGPAGLWSRAGLVCGFRGLQPLSFPEAAPTALPADPREGADTFVEGDLCRGQPDIPALGSGSGEEVAAVWPSCWLARPAQRSLCLCACFNLRRMVRKAHALKLDRLESSPASVQTL